MAADRERGVTVIPHPAVRHCATACQRPPRTVRSPVASEPGLAPSLSLDHPAPTCRSSSSPRNMRRNSPKSMTPAGACEYDDTIRHMRLGFERGGRTPQHCRGTGGVGGAARSSSSAAAQRSTAVPRQYRTRLVHVVLLHHMHELVVAGQMGGWVGGRGGSCGRLRERGRGCRASSRRAQSPDAALLLQRVERQLACALAGSSSVPPHGLAPRVPEALKPAPDGLLQLLEQLEELGGGDGAVAAAVHRPASTQEGGLGARGSSPGPPSDDAIAPPATPPLRPCGDRPLARRTHEPARQAGGLYRARTLHMQGRTERPAGTLPVYRPGTRCPGPFLQTRQSCKVVGMGGGHTEGRAQHGMFLSSPRSLPPAIAPTSSPNPHPPAPHPPDDAVAVGVVLRHHRVNVIVRQPALHGSMDLKVDPDGSRLFWCAAGALPVCLGEDRTPPRCLPCTRPALSRLPCPQAGHPTTYAPRCTAIAFILSIKKKHAPWARRRCRRPRAPAAREAPLCQSRRCCAEALTLSEAQAGRQAGGGWVGGC